MTVGRNDPCPCGSGKKHKKCCLREQVSFDARVDALRSAQRIAEGEMGAYAAEILGEHCIDDAWGDFLEPVDVEFERGGPEMQVFVPWFYYDWRPWVYDEDPGPHSIPDVRVLAEGFLEDGSDDLEEEERRFVEAALETPWSFHDVLEVTPGRSLLLKDILLGHERVVAERSGSRTLQKGDIVYAKVVPIGPFALMIGTGAVPFPPIEKRVILDVRKSMPPAGSGADFLKRIEPDMRRLYFGVAHRLMNPEPPRMSNTDGDPIEFHTLTYQIESPAAAFQALKPLALGVNEAELLRDAEVDEAGAVRRATVPWLKKGNKVNKAWENTSLGEISIDGNQLKVTVNSAKRAARFKKEIAARLPRGAALVEDAGSSLEEALEKERHKSPKEALESARREEETARFQSRPEVQAALKAYMERHWEAWIDQKIPALGGKTPRQAVKSRDGREMVEALLLDYERLDGRVGKPPVDYARIRARLGLDPG